EDGIRDKLVTGVQTCALPIFLHLLGPVPRRQHPHRVAAADGAGRSPPDRALPRHRPALQPARLPEGVLVQGRIEDGPPARAALRSEEHTSELQSLAYLVCRLL